jgi:adenylate cyclase
MLLTLVVHPGTLDEQRFSLAPGPNTVGRSPENQVFIVHPSLSRSHARLDIDGEAITVNDLGSKNGTYVEGRRIETSSPLRAGDTFRCGDVVLYLAEDDFVAHRLREESASIDALLGLRAAEQPQRDQAKLGILLRVSQVLSQPEPIQSLLRKIFELLFQVFDVDRGAVLLVDEATGKLKQVLARGRDGGALEGRIYSQHIVDHVLEHSVGTLSVDAITDPRFNAAQSIADQSIRSFMCVPMRTIAGVVGVLYVDHQSLPGHYSEDDLDFLGGFGNQAALAIENARLAHRLQDEAVRRSNLQRFFSPTVLRAVGELGMVPRDHQVTVLFSDITDFTRLSSTMEPRDVVALLNRYFPAMAEIVFRHEGTLEKYIGDALMAIWGAPLPHDDDADRALAAALEMMDALDRLNHEWGHDEPLSIHVGLNSGPVAFGNIGSADYVQYAAIGDATNIAARVCSVAQGGEVVISASTRDRLLQPAPLEALPLVQVKGRDQPLELYRVIRR